MSIKEEIKAAGERIKALATVYEQCHPDFVEALIFEQLAAEKRYNALLSIARKEG